MVLLLGLAHAQQAEFESGIIAMRQGSYPVAAAELVAALEAGGVDPAVYHALGNALYRQEHHGAAIAAWSRGLALDPGSGDLAANLERAQAQTTDRLEVPQPAYGPFFWQVWFSLRGSATLASLCITVALVLLGLRRRRESAIAAAAGGLLLVSTIVAVDATAGAVVVGEAVSVRSALGPDGVELFVLHEGAQVAVEERTPTHTLVVLPDSRKGWAPSEALISTDPEDPFPLNAL